VAETRPLPVALAEAAGTHPDDVLIQTTTGDLVTYGSFRDKGLSLASALARMTSDGSRVASMLPNSVEAYLVWIGAAWAGRVEVALDPHLRGQTLVHALNTSGAELAVVYGEEQLSAIQAVEASLTNLKTVVLVRCGDFEGRPARLNTVGLPDLLQTEASLEPYNVAGHDVATILFTSGTTGPAKGVLVPWARFQHSPPQYFPGCSRADVEGGAFYQVWPTHHASGKVGLAISVELGLRMVLRERFSVRQFWEDVHEYKITHSLLVFGANYIMESGDQEKNKSNTLRQVMMAPLIPEYRKFEETYSVKVTTGYGQSEIGFAFFTDNPPNYRTVGKPSPGYEVRLVDEHDYEVPAGEPGELIVRHDQPWRLNLGYIGMPEETAAAWRNGWFHTGDVFRRDADGNMYFVDRVRDYIRRKGENVSSFEVESVALSHPEVAECACVGIPSDRNAGHHVADDDILLVAVLTEGSRLTADELAAYIDDRVPPRMFPDYIVFQESLPRTHTNKVRKAAIREAGVDSNAWRRPKRGQRLTDPTP
jgi:crotonobetaine/carnitine-CoA ligase